MKNTQLTIVEIISPEFTKQLPLPLGNLQTKIIYWSDYKGNYSMIDIMADWRFTVNRSADLARGKTLTLSLFLIRP
jgi:hypothetical protein